MCTMCGKSFNMEYPLMLADGTPLSFCQDCLESMLNELKAKNVKQVCGNPASNLANMLNAMFGVEFIHAEDLDEKSFTPDEDDVDEDRLLKPREIMDKLNKYIIGQDKAKKVISVAVYNHCKRIKANRTDIEKSNIMLIGSTGVGKTEIARTIAKIMDVPFAITDSTGKSETGYVGGSVEDIIIRLINNCDGDVKKAEHGIIYIDEIDKLATHNDGGKDVSGGGVQEELLKIVEGTVLDIPVGRGSRKKMVQIDTSNILFICGGAFASLTMKEKSKKHALGFNSQDSDEEEQEFDAKALSKYGMLPELIGRFPIRVKLDDLEVDDLKRILIEPENSIVKQYKNLLDIDGVELVFGDSALQFIAEKAKDSGTGARGLRSIIEESMTDLMYALPDEENVKKVTIVRQGDKLGHRITRLEAVSA